jgi:type III restriction enzyme
MLELKRYQKNALEVLEAYLSACRSGNDPEGAFRASLVKQGVVKPGSEAAVRYVKPSGLEDIPYVCVRIPTGGGKTILASYAIERARKVFLQTDYPLILWLVPSNTIREQTIDCLRTAGHPYRRALEERFGENIRVFDIGDLEALAPQDLGSKLVIVIGTIQTLRVTDEAGRRIYAHSEAWERHFVRAPRMAGLDAESEGKRKGKVKHSFVNLCRIFRPFVIMDEAHNARTGLTFDTLARLAPSGIFELTATPNNDAKSGSNVLFAVSATELKTENMIKLPIHLAEHSSWKEAVSAAIHERSRLEGIASTESRYLRPIVLFQAENKDREVTVDVLRKQLFEAEGVTEDELAVVTGSIRELDGIDLFSSACTIKYIITVQALKEGWDCSFAYVFCSVANISSQKDVEQLLGRVLRLPDARPFTRPELNNSYAHVSNTSFSDAASELKDKLVSKLGFASVEADLYVDPVATYLIPPDAGQGFAMESIAKDYGSVSVVVSAEPDFSLLPEPTRGKLTVSKRGQDLVLTIGGAIDETEAKAISELVAKGPRADRIRHAIHTYRAVAINTKSGPVIKSFSVPELQFPQAEGMMLESGHFAQLGGFSLSRGELCSPNLTEAEFSPRTGVKLADIDVERGAVVYSYGESESSGASWLYEAGDPDWEVARLVAWLCGELRSPDLFQHELSGFIVRAVRYLTDVRGLKLAELGIYKYALADSLGRKLEQARRAAARKGFELFAGSDHPARTLVLSWDFSFDRNQPPYTNPQDLVAGGYRFQKHFYPMIQDIKDRGEELECAKIFGVYWNRRLP